MSPSSHTPPADSNNGSRSWWAKLGNFVADWLWRRWRSDDVRETDGLPSSVERGHEAETDANVGGAVALSVALLAMIGLCLLVLVGLVRWFGAAEDEAPSRFADVEREPPEPRLQHDPAVDLADLHRRTRERLGTYGWVDSARRVVHIPIDRAMALVAERGLPYDTTARADSVRRVLSESGFAWELRGPPPPSAPAYRGRSPEPFVPSDEILRKLAPPGTPRLDESSSPSEHQ